MSVKHLDTNISRGQYTFKPGCNRCFRAIIRKILRHLKSIKPLWANAISAWVIVLDRPVRQDEVNVVLLELEPMTPCSQGKCFATWAILLQLISETERVIKSPQLQVLSDDFLYIFLAKTDALKHTSKKVLSLILKTLYFIRIFSCRIGFFCRLAIWRKIVLSWFQDGEKILFDKNKGDAGAFLLWEIQAASCNHTCQDEENYTFFRVKIRKEEEEKK